MNPYQQQPDPFGGGYQNYVNRSPTSNRPGYATTGGLQGITRQLSQRQQQQQPQQPQLEGMYPGITNRGNAYDNADPYDRMSASAASTLQSNSFMTNQAAWNYSASPNPNTIATVNGPMNEGMRSRGSRRQPIPDNWMMPQNDTATYAQGLLPTQQQMFPSQALGGYGGHLSNGVDPYSGMQASESLGMHSQQDKKSEELIPTAIVIKNIPFAVRKETLQDIMQGMGLPQPYAFNYHFDNGVFRGLAFANFQNPQDTRMVIDNLNQKDVGGRKLRVEYKKMLPEHERERIEREKRQKRGQLEEQHRPITLNHQGSLQSLTSNQEPVPVSQQRPSPTRKSSDPTHLLYPTNFGTESEIDMNDPMCLNFYTILTMFKSGDKEIYEFPPSLTNVQRRQVHILAHGMNLEHRSVDDGDRRYIRILKRAAAAAQASAAEALAASAARQQMTLNNGSLASGHRGLSRAATFDLSEPRNGYSTMGRQGNPTLEVTGNSPEHMLRGAKSFADLRRTPSPGQDTLDRRYFDAIPALAGNSALTTPTTPSGPLTNRASESSLVNNMNSLSLGVYESNRQRENHGTIGGQRASINGVASRNASERQLRGPGPDNTWDVPNGGGSFNRVRANGNGHKQRSSGGSSNLTSDNYQDNYQDLLSTSDTITRAGNSAGSYQH